MGGCDDWADEEDEVSAGGGAGVDNLLGDEKCGAVRRVALGSLGWGCTTALESTNGKKGGESVSSSSASESGPRGALELEWRGRRMYARLRDNWGAAADSEDEEELESSALLDGLAAVSFNDGLSF